MKLGSGNTRLHVVYSQCIKMSSEITLTYKSLSKPDDPSSKVRGIYLLLVNKEVKEVGKGWPCALT